MAAKKRPQLFVSVTDRVRRMPWLYKTLIGVGIPLWVVASFYAAQLLLVAAVYGLTWAGIDFGLLRESVFETILSGAMYALTLVIVVGVPLLIWRRRPSIKDMGFKDVLPLWRDVALAPPVFVGAMVSSSLALALVGQLLPGLNIETEQEVGFELVSQRYELLLAYITLAVIGPILEEVLFRGYLHGVLRKRLSKWVTIGITAATFSALHLGIGQLADWQWNVAIDTFVLSLWLGFMRERTGTIWVPIFVHMIKNTLAFYILFVAPSMPTGGM
ncbi:MAG: lysostaphin resistance A-like protein [Candidatus Saccharimonadales bacterium]